MAMADGWANRRARDDARGTRVDAVTSPKSANVARAVRAAKFVAGSAEHVGRTRGGVRMTVADEGASADAETRVDNGNT